MPYQHRSPHRSIHRIVIIHTQYEAFHLYTNGDISASVKNEAFHLHINGDISTLSDGLQVKNGDISVFS